MAEITQAQAKSLEGFTEQRDRLVDEIKELTPGRDNLLKDLNQYSTALSDIKTEIAENKRTVIESAIETERELASHKEQKTALAKEVELITVEIDSKKKELATLHADIATVKEALRGALEYAQETVETIRAIRKEAKDSVDSINNGASEVVRVTTGMSNLVDEFFNKLVSQEVSNEKRRLELDQRETTLDTRETAIEITYSEIIKAMEKDGIHLSELNQQDPFAAK